MVIEGRKEAKENLKKGEKAETIRKKARGKSIKIKELDSVEVPPSLEDEQLPNALRGGQHLEGGNSNGGGEGVYSVADLIFGQPLVPVEQIADAEIQNQINIEVASRLNVAKSDDWKFQGK